MNLHARTSRGSLRTQAPARAQALREKAGMQAAPCRRSSLRFGRVVLSSRASQKLQIRCIAAPGAPEKSEKAKQVDLKVGEYKNGAIQVTKPVIQISDEEVDAAFKIKTEKKYNLVRVNFTGSGAKIGHTVKINFEGKYAEGSNIGQTIKGTKATMYELELKEGQKLPWCDFVKSIVEAGMGQEESKTFETRFPDDYPAKPMQGVKATFTLTVKEIAVKENIEPDSRPVEEQRAEIRATLQAAAERKADDEVNGAIRTALMATTYCDSKKVEDSVSWAKFGPQSIADYTWNLVLEEISLMEGIDFQDVLPFLRSQADISAENDVSEDMEDSGAGDIDFD